MLREKIKQAIEDNQGDAGAASKAVCKVLEDEIGLAGNGWFDNDKELLQHLGLVDDGDSE